jgi:nucleotide-binding universal stress UspA family protein
MATGRLPTTISVDTERIAMFKKIMWATDGSAAADAALPQVRDLASLGASVVVCHCEETLVGPRAYGLDEYVDEPAVIEKVKNQAKALEDDGLKVETEFVGIRSGLAAHAIADVAKKDGADVIVVGTRGHTSLGGLLLGSVTQRLLQVTPCPVLAVPAHDAEQARAAEQVAS